MSKPSLFARLFGRASTVSPVAALARITARPMMIAPASLQALIAAAGTMPERQGYSDSEGGPLEGSTPETLITVADGIGVIKIHGPLFQRWDIWAWWYGGTGYDVIEDALEMLLADTNVQSIVLDVDSPGGDCAGCADLADEIFAARGKKPIVAVINDMGYSAAYWLASAADKVYVTRTAGAGSVGVIATHVDISQWDRNMGVGYDMVFAGDKKADYSPHKPLSESARADLKAEVDRLYEMFADGVARNRKLGLDVVKATQAGCYFGPGAVQVGFADEIATLDDVLSTLGARDEADDETPAGEVADPADGAEGDPEEPAAATMAAAAASGGGGAQPAAAALQPVVEGPANVTINIDARGAEDPATLAAVLAQAKSAPGAPAKPDHAAQSAALVAAFSTAKLPAEISMALIRRGRLTDSAEAQITEANAIRDLCAAAKLDSAAADYVQRGVAVETVRADLAAAVAASGPEVVTTLPAGIGGTVAPGLWGAIIKRFGGK